MPALMPAARNPFAAVTLTVRYGPAVGDPVAGSSTWWRIHQVTAIVLYIVSTARAAVGPSRFPARSRCARASATAATHASRAANAATGSVPIVPVVDFRSTLLSVTITDVRSILNGHHAIFTSLELVSSDADPILAAIGVDRPDVPTRLVLAASVAALDKDLAAHSDRLAFIRADSVTPAVRAIGLGSSRSNSPLLVVKNSASVSARRTPIASS